mgnify:CR=1 FL=1
MDHQTGAKLRFEPRRLRRHNITRIGDIHQLLHRNGIQSQATFISPLSTRRFNSPRPRILPPKSIRLSERKSLMPKISSRIKFEEIVTSNTPIGALSSYVPGLAVKEYHFPPKYREKLCKAPGFVNSRALLLYHEVFR